ncbi:glycosyltransferase family 2 protein [Pontibacter lucknowensis]|uniref:Glycosyl transferase family 2 n=1 Tax=Pontibacter lucknowensis TaxID=1077936 RepID=A0A1N7AZ27_9BACT|nr:glycosyltransferase family 2 protein [Pontibacter lucknowensis]SIR44407.1 Glycosyl transferase family 2 [Pontibacter lucknowensis]
MHTNPTPLVSVITAFLNEEKFLGEAIESVLQQDYTHWELILVDDGSTDHSTAIAQTYAARYPGKVFYYDHPGHINRGLSASRNAGIEQARGKLVAFLDADDVWLPCKLSQQVALFQEEQGIAMVAEASFYWYSWEHPEQQDIAIPVGAPQDRAYAPGSLTSYLYPLHTGAAPCPSGLMLTKEAIVRAGGFEESFTKEFQLYEDQAFLHKIYLQEKVYISSACQNMYRQRTGSIVEKVKSDGHYHMVRRYFLEWLENYLQESQQEESSTSRLLEKALLPYRYPRRYFAAVTFPSKVKGAIKKGFKSLVR